MGEKLIDKYNIKLTDCKTKLKVDGRIGKSQKDTEWLKAHKQEVIQILLDREEQAEKARAEYRQKLESVEGLAEVESCIAEWNEYNSKMSRYIERDCTGEAPEKPEKTIEELQEQYPKAAAYITADRWSYASHYHKSTLGSRAKERILNGEDYKDVIADMKDSWKKYTEETFD